MRAIVVALVSASEEEGEQGIRGRGNEGEEDEKEQGLPFFSSPRLSLSSLTLARDSHSDGSSALTLLAPIRLRITAPKIATTPAIPCAHTVWVQKPSIYQKVRILATQGVSHLRPQLLIE